MGRLTVALDAYRASLKVTGDQRVFLGWAQAWRSTLRDDAIRKQVVRISIRLGCIKQTAPSGKSTLGTPPSTRSPCNYLRNA